MRSLLTCVPPAETYKPHSISPSILECSRAAREFVKISLHKDHVIPDQRREQRLGQREF